MKLPNTSFNYIDLHGFQYIEKVTENWKQKSCSSLHFAYFQYKFYHIGSWGEELVYRLLQSDNDNVNSLKTTQPRRRLCVFRQEFPSKK